MDKERIKKIRDRKYQAYLRQTDNYQSSGEGKYDYRAKAYEEIVEICDIALTKVDGLNETARLHNVIQNLARQADDCLHYGLEDTSRVRALVQCVLQLGKNEGYQSRWE